MRGKHLPGGLSTTEDMLWRALMRIVISLPRHLDADLGAAAAITGNEYLTLVALHEAPDNELRMAMLADAAGLSASRMTRIVGDLQTRELVRKRVCSTDGRGHVASLTPVGLAKLRLARRAHLSSLRRLVYDHLDPAVVPEAARALSEIATRLEAR